MKLHYIILFTFITTAYIAQQNSVKAYVVNLKGDTIKGEVQLNPKKPLMIYDKVVFKDNNGVQKNYKPDKLKAYGFEDEHFIAFTYDGEPKFYKILATGTINFYEVSFEYLQGKEVLKESEYFLAQADNKKLFPVKTAKFKKQLSEWTKDKPEIAEEYVDDKEFNLETALKQISAYNAWKASQ